MKKTTLVGGGLAGLLATAAGTLAWTGHAQRTATRRLWDRLQSPPAGALERFDPETVAGLPDPARRYLLHAIAPGTPLAHAVALEMEGRMRLKPDAPWMSMRARQILAPPRGFVWEAAVARGAMRFAGADAYADGEGATRFRLWGVLPVAQATGPDVARSARGRLAIEAVLCPAALLPQRGVRWEPIDAHTARAVLTIDGEALPVTLTVDDEGRLQAATLPRWGRRADDGRFAPIPFGVDVLEEGRFGGYTLPCRLHVGWWYGTEQYFDFFHAVIRKALFRAV